MSDSPIIKILLAVVPLLTATFYLLGLTYYEGFLGAFGLEPSLFPLAPDTTLLYGFFSLGAIGLQPFYNIFLIVLSLFLIIVVGAVLSLHAYVKVAHSKIAPKLLRLMPSKEVSGILDKSSTGYLYIAGAFLLVFLPFFIAVLSIKTGEEQAKLSMKKFNNQTGKWIMLYSSHSIAAIRAYQITCGSTHCAFWLGNESLILAHDKVEKVVVYNSDSKNR